MDLCIYVDVWRLFKWDIISYNTNIYEMVLYLNNLPILTIIIDLVDN